MIANDPVKQQTIKLLQVTTWSSMMGKTHTIKQAVKGLTINQVKLIIKDQNPYKNLK